MNGYGRDQALVCENGHVLNEYAQFHANLNREFCDRCGAKAIGSCPSCDAQIPGGYNYAHDYGTYPTQDYVFERPAFCGACGQSFPWTKSSLDAARALADELDGLSPEERERLKQSLEEITLDTPQAEVAATRIKKVMAKVGGEGAKSLGRIVESIATQAAKDMILRGGL